MARPKGKKTRKSPIATELSFAGDDIGNPSTIYMLGGEPIYVHNNINNALIGMKVASNIVDKALEEARESAIRELDNQLQVLEDKKSQFNTVLQRGGISLEKFVEIFNDKNNRDKITDGTNFSKAIEYLLKLKTNVLKFSRFSDIVENAKKKDKTTFKLYYKGGSQEFDIKIAIDKKADLEKSIKDTVEELSDLVDKDSIAKNAIDKFMEEAFPENESGDGDKLLGNLSKQRVHSLIGNIFEVIGVSERRPLGKNLEVELTNISAELRKAQEGTTNTKEQGFNKSDTLVRIYDKQTQELLYSFTTSDKTSINA